MENKGRFYVLFDERAAGGSTDDAVVIECIGYFRKRSIAIWRANQASYGYPTCLYSYHDDGKVCADERLEKVWRPK